MGTSLGPDEGFHFEDDHYYGKDVGNYKWEYSHTTDSFLLRRTYQPCSDIFGQQPAPEPRVDDNWMSCSEAFALFECMKDWSEHPGVFGSGVYKEDHSDVVASSLYQKISNARKKDPTGEIKIMLGDIHLGTVKDGKITMHTDPEGRPLYDDSQE